MNEKRAQHKQQQCVVQFWNIYGRVRTLYMVQIKPLSDSVIICNNWHHILWNTKFKANESPCTIFGEMSCVTKQHFPFHVWMNKLYRWYSSLWKQCYNSIFMSLRYFISLLTIWEARKVEYSGLLSVSLRHHHHSVV